MNVEERLRQIDKRFEEIDAEEAGMRLREEELAKEWSDLWVEKLRLQEGE